MERSRSVITLTSDFGLKDPFVGQMKGVIFGINPEVEIIDLTHEVSPQNIREGAVILGLSYRYFPKRTVHLAVVDPGVGSSRRPILVVTEHHYFVGPDNGLFSAVYKREADFLKVIHITAEHYFINKDSPTFQGRDLFAPIAGWLSRGIPVSHFGEEIEDFMTIHLPEWVSPREGVLEGEIMYIDRFGNAITNIPSDVLAPFIQGDERVRIVLKGRQVPMKRHYAEAEDRGLYCLINSFGLLEFFIYRGNAAENFGLKTGDMVGVLKI